MTVPPATVSVAPDVTLGENVEFRGYARLSGSTIGNACLIGAHTEVHNGVDLADGVKLFGFNNLYGCRVGPQTKIGAFVEIQKNASVGANCKISSHSFVCEGVVIEDEVFIGHQVCFINDRFPRATTDGKLQIESDWQVERTRIKRGASVGSGATILCGVTIGAKAIIGAGSVVTKDVPDGEIWAGNPARFLRKIER